MTAATPPEPTAKPARTSEQVHQREVAMRIMLPLVGAFLLMLGAMLAALLVPSALGRPVDVHTLSGIMLVLFILVPQCLCLLVFYLFLVTLIFGLDAFTGGTARQLRRLHRLTHTLASTTQRTTDRINQQTANLRVRIAPLEQVMEDTFKRADEANHERTDIHPNDDNIPPRA